MKGGCLAHGIYGERNNPRVSICHWAASIIGEGPRCLGIRLSQGGQRHPYGAKIGRSISAFHCGEPWASVVGVLPKNGDMFGSSASLC